MRQWLRIWPEFFEKRLQSSKSFLGPTKHERSQCRSYSNNDGPSTFDAIRATVKQGALLAFHSDNHEVPLDEKHRFPMTKYRLTRLALEADTSVQGLLEIREVTWQKELPDLGHAHKSPQPCTHQCLAIRCINDLTNGLTQFFLPRHHKQQRKSSRLRTTQLMYSVSSRGS